LPGIAGWFNPFGFVARSSLFGLLFFAAASSPVGLAFFSFNSRSDQESRVDVSLPFFSV
jgi:hypothetical protein